MKLIAISDFHNTGGRIQVADAIHPMHVHKGAVFEVGTGDDFKKLSKEDQKFLAYLKVAKRIDDGNNAELVKRIQAEGKAEREKEARRAAATPTARFV